MTPETAPLLQHWRSHRFGDIRPFFCQVEAGETAIWLTEVGPQRGREERQVLDHLDQASQEANPGLARLALKLATGAGKTTVMAMLIAWQSMNAVRRPGSRRFTCGFLVVTPGRDDPGPAAGVPTQRSRQLLREPRAGAERHAPGPGAGEDRRHELPRVPCRRETLPLSKGGRALLQGPGPELRTKETEGADAAARHAGPDGA